MPSSWRRPTSGDVITAALVLAVYGVLKLLFGGELAAGRRAPDLGSTLLTAAAVLPAVLVRWRPLLPALTGLAALLAGVLAGYAMVAPALVIVWLVGFAALRSPTATRVALALGSGLTYAVMMGVRVDSQPAVAAIGGFAVGVLPVMVAERLRTERARVAAAQALARRTKELHDREVQRAVAEERLRIARDMHDITGHQLSAISLQSAGAGGLTADPEARDAFERIRRLSVDALDETRRSLGLLRDGGEPAELTPPPRLAHVEQLLEPVRAAGVDVALVVEGDARDLPDSVEVSAYRVIQESMTNVMRHAHARSVRIVLTYEPTTLVLSVYDDGSGSRGRDVRSGGGIEGMRERVARAGGTLTTGPRDGRGWAVQATLPLEAVA